MALPDDQSRDHPPLRRASLPQMLQRLGAATLDVLMPPQCLNCGASVEHHGGLCGGCWSTLSFVAGSQCEICGTPFELAMGEGAVCAACLRARPVYHRARSALRYDEAARRLILSFKRADRTELAPLLATWLHHAGQALLEDADFLVPVPLHRWRLFQRRYNQAGLLAHALGARCNITVLPDKLVRKRATGSQAGLTRVRRRRNVRGAFDIDDRATDIVAGRNLVIIDDVMTTGATVSACAQRLIKAGARRIDVLTVARVVRENDETA